MPYLPARGKYLLTHILLFLLRLSIAAWQTTPKWSFLKCTFPWVEWASLTWGLSYSSSEVTGEAMAEPRHMVASSPCIWGSDASRTLRKAWASQSMLVSGSHLLTWPPALQRLGAEGSSRLISSRTDTVYLLPHFTAQTVTGSTWIQGDSGNRKQPCL